MPGEMQEMPDGTVKRVRTKEPAKSPPAQSPNAAAIKETIEDLNDSIKVLNEDLVKRLDELDDKLKCLAIIKGGKNSEPFAVLTETVRALGAEVAELKRTQRGMIDGIAASGRIFVAGANNETGRRAWRLVRVVERWVEREEARDQKRKPEKVVVYWSKRAGLALVIILAIIGLFVSTGWVFE